MMYKFTKYLKLFTLSTLMVLSMSFCEQHSEIEPEKPETVAEFDTELNAALELMETNPRASLDKLDEVIVEAEAIKSNYYSGKAKWYKAYIYDDLLEDVSLAYETYHEALKDVLLTNDSELKRKLYNNIGLLHRFYGEYDGAIATYELALELRDDLDSKALSDIYYNLGVALKLKGDDVSFERAEQSFTKSLNLAIESDYHENVASVYNQIGLMYKAIENYEMARLSYENTIDTYISDPEMLNYVGKAYHGIGVTYMDQGNLEAAVRAFNKALEYKTSSGSIFITKYDLGTVLLRDGREDEAIVVWKDALNEKHNKNSREQVQIYSDLTSVLKANDQFEEALSYSEIYNSSIQNILKEDEKYKAESDRVLFANVVKDYAAFNEPTPFFLRPMVLIFSILTMIGLVYAVAYSFYRSKSKKKVSEVVTKIQSEFLDIKVD